MTNLRKKKAMLYSQIVYHSWMVRWAK